MPSEVQQGGKWICVQPKVSGPNEPSKPYLWELMRNLLEYLSLLLMLLLLTFSLSMQMFLACGDVIILSSPVFRFTWLRKKYLNIFAYSIANAFVIPDTCHSNLKSYPKMDVAGKFCLDYIKFGKKSSNSN